MGFKEKKEMFFNVIVEKTGVNASQIEYGDLRSLL
jgi:hypothetical protein